MTSLRVFVVVPNDSPQKYISLVVRRLNFKVTAVVEGPPSTFIQAHARPPTLLSSPAELYTVRHSCI